MSVAAVARELRSGVRRSHRLPTGFEGADLFYYCTAILILPTPMFEASTAEHERTEIQPMCGEAPEHFSE
jgi:hypothetical protein